MELVAGSKMRRSQTRALQARPYAEKLLEVLGDLAKQQGDEEQHPFLTVRPVQRNLILFLNANRGLAGGLPSNMNRRAATFALEQEAPVEFVTLGKKGRDFIVRTGQPLVGEFTMPDYPGLLDTLPVTRPPWASMRCLASAINSSRSPNFVAPVGQTSAQAVG